MGVAGDPPQLGLHEYQATHCWNWLGGWRPELLPAYLALHPVDDLVLLIDLLNIIRNEIGHGQ